MKFVRLETTYKNGSTSSEPFLFCTGCHSFLLHESNFCPGCGRKLNRSPKLSQIIKMNEGDVSGFEETLNYVKERIKWQEIDTVKLGSIVFAPICSKCKNIITDTINYNEEPESFDYPTMNYILNRKYTITPYCCPNCGTIFKSIAIPTRFPIKLEDMLFVTDAVVD